MIFDGLRNLVSRLGTDRDKASAATYWFMPLSVGELQAAYRSSWLAQQIVDIPAQDCVQAWRSWQAGKDEISKLEAEEKRLDLVAKVKQAVTLARLYGGAGIYIGTGDINVEQPLNVERARIQYLTVLSNSRLAAGQIQMDPRLPGFGKPAYYTMGGGVKVHPSRVAAFYGAELPDIDMSGTGWGDSVLQATLDAVKAHDSLAANILSLTYEAKVDVVKIPNLMSNLAQRGAEYETALLNRWQLAMTGKGINGALMMDAEEEYEQKTISFGGLNQLWDRFMIAVSGASDIPATRLFGRSPAGMNATGESDAKNYQNTIRGLQVGGIEPALANIDEMLIRQALGARPEQVHFNWRPLSEPSSKEKAEIADKLTSAFERVHRMAGLVPDEALGRAVVNALTETGVAPGLEADYAEFYTGPDGDDDAEGDDTVEGAAAITLDGRHRTLYVHRKVLNASDIIRWAKAQGFATTLPADDLHVTVTFSRTAVDWMAMGESWQSRVEVEAGGPREMEQFGEARVLKFASSDLQWRHRQMREVGASWDHPEYQPHITISYDPDAPDIAEIEAYQGPIILGPEVFQEVKEDWKEGISEE